jgi:hypothetical protein
VAEVIKLQGVYIAMSQGYNETIIRVNTGRANVQIYVQIYGTEGCRIAKRIGCNITITGNSKLNDNQYDGISK